MRSEQAGPDASPAESTRRDTAARRPVKRLAVMQPYFFPYIGYFQLMHAVDEFVVYDNIQYTKKGWINRNRFLLDGSDELFSIPLKKDSDYLDIVERSVAAHFNTRKLLNQLTEAYRKAPQFEPVFSLIEQILLTPEVNLFAYVRQSIEKICAFLDIATPIVASSTVDIDHSLRGKDKVIALCRALAADVYINSIGGQALYAPDEFREHGIELRFLKARAVEYAQLGKPFVPFLSILDVMMFNDKAALRDLIANTYDLT